MNSYKFKIGVVGWCTGDNSFGVTKPYMEHLAEYGTLVVLTPHEVADTSLDMVVMPGGKDTAAWAAGSRPSYYNSDSDQFKEYFMRITLQAYIDAGIPIWGTCLGFQQLAVHFGSKVTQNLGNHPTTHHERRWEAAHRIIVSPEYKPLEDKVLGQNKKVKDKPKHIEVNSLHHQGILVEDLSEELTLVSHSPDNIVEHFVHPTLPIAGAQSHVEEDYNLFTNILFYKNLCRSPLYLLHNNQEQINQVEHEEVNN